MEAELKIVIEEDSRDKAPLSSGESSDSELLRAAQEGSKAAFGEIYERHAGRVFGLCLRLSGKPADAEELMQEIFLRAWQNIRKLDSGAHLRAWLHRVTTNQWINQLRKKNRWGVLVSLETHEHFLKSHQPVCSIRLDLEQAVAALPQAYRAVVVLHDIYGYKHREIADLLDIPVGTSKVQLHRARRLLREVLDA